MVTGTIAFTVGGGRCRWRPSPQPLTQLQAFSSLPPSPMPHINTRLLSVASANPSCRDLVDSKAAVALPRRRRRPLEEAPESAFKRLRVITIRDDGKGGSRHVGISWGAMTMGPQRPWSRSSSGSPAPTVALTRRQHRSPPNIIAFRPSAPRSVVRSTKTVETLRETTKSPTTKIQGTSCPKSPTTHVVFSDSLPPSGSDDSSVARSPRPSVSQSPRPLLAPTPVSPTTSRVSGEPVVASHCECLPMPEMQLHIAFNV